jgi:replication factor C small subunit
MKRKIEQVLNSVSTMPHLILYGPPGTGKTTIARILADKVLGKRTEMNYMELNASADRGVDIIRNQVLAFISNSSFTRIGAPDAPYKIVFLDEADSLTVEAQNSLKNMLETYSQKSRFILSCNNYNKIIAPLISRCLPIKFDVVDSQMMLNKLKKDLEEGKIKCKKGQLDQVVQNAKGDFRKAYTSLAVDPTEYEDLTKELESIVTRCIKQIETPSTQSFTVLTQILNLKKQTLETNYKEFFEFFFEKIIENHNIESSKVLGVLDRAAKAEWGILLGGSLYTQLVGVLAYAVNPKN